jgi:hypothetical protein
MGHHGGVRTPPLVLVTALLTLLVAGACGSVDDDEDLGGSPLRPREPVELHEDAAEIYAAVIRAVVTDDDGDRGRVFVRSSIGGAHDEEGATVLPLRVQARIVELLEKLPPVEFVDVPDRVIGDDDEVRAGGMIIRLGDIEEGRDEVRVPVAWYADAEEGPEIHHVVRRVDGAWEAVSTREARPAD